MLRESAENPRAAYQTLHLSVSMFDFEVHDVMMI